MNIIDVNKFYGNETTTKQKIQKKRVNCKPYWVRESRKMPSSILGPSDFWREFEKQAEALETAFRESKDFDMLCTFVYQGDNGYRKFVVAHPEKYWWYYKDRSPEKRCSYEVIPENFPCRLYLDLEYSIELNPEKDGPSMTNMVIDIFCNYLFTRWGFPYNKYNVLNLDSSTNEKFSRHLIFNIKDVAFKNNYHVGRLVKSACKDILNYISLKEMQHDVLSCFDKPKLEQLIVETKKDKKLFIDTAVYTKNRHFRIYKSTKWGKQSNLVVSNDCKYTPSIMHNDKELNIFLDSLVSYFSTRKDLILLECSESGIVDMKCSKKEIEQCNYHENNSTYSKYPILDKYISNLICPGRIRVCKYIESVKILIYETSGYRYCENIGRCHKSNNIFLVVDLKDKIIYQKCHDQDCFGFKSKSKRLPEEICFQIDEENDTLLSCAVITDGVI